MHKSGTRTFTGFMQGPGVGNINRGWVPTWLLMILVTTTLILPPCAMAGEWTFLGPEGGDARKLAFDPQNPDRILLGTNAGALFASEDAGRTWSFRAQIGENQDYVLDDIAFDPRETNIVYVAAWSVEQKDRGGVFKSTDGGYNWQALPAMDGKSVRAVALAPSDPHIILAGALEGVFRSDDAGQSWRTISAGAEGPRNVGAVAVHPADPDIIFAGTFHLPWQTMNAGRTWSLVRSGLIDDSDIFSIFIDPRNPDTVFVSACSGIYRSTDGGKHFRKLIGIPFSARRTRVIREHPANSSLIYAGTTEGLWRSLDGGLTWGRLTDRNVVINDVLLDTRNTNHLLLAADRIGILATYDGGRTFQSSNHGFFHRQLRAIAISADSNMLYAAGINGKEFGGVFASRDGGSSWKQISDGLAGRDVFALQQSSGGTLVAGTQDGIFVLDPNTLTWEATDRPYAGTPHSLLRIRRSREKNTGASMGRVSQLRTVVSNGSEWWHAAAAEGIFSSADQGHTWSGGPIAGEKMFTTLDVEGMSILAATPKHVFLSLNGSHWEELSIPQGSIPIAKVSFGSNSAIWLMTRLGAFRTSDWGKTWQQITAQDRHDISYVAFDSECSCLLALDASRTEVLESYDDGHTWLLLARSQRPLRNVTVHDQKLIAVTDFDGLIARPITAHVIAPPAVSSSLR